MVGFVRVLPFSSCVGAVSSSIVHGRQSMSVRPDGPVYRFNLKTASPQKWQVPRWFTYCSIRYRDGSLTAQSDNKHRNDDDCELDHTSPATGNSLSISMQSSASIRSLPKNASITLMVAPGPRMITCLVCRSTIRQPSGPSALEYVWKLSLWYVRFVFLSIPIWNLHVELFEHLWSHHVAHEALYRLEEHLTPHKAYSR